MNTYKVLLLVFLPGIITLIYLSCNEANVSRRPLNYPILNSRIAGAEDYLKRENQKSLPKSGLIIHYQIKKFRTVNHANDTASAIFCGVSILDLNPTTGLKIFNDEIFISNDFATKKRNLNCCSRIVVCKDSSGNVKYRVKFSF